MEERIPTGNRLEASSSDDDSRWRSSMQDRYHTMIVTLSGRPE